ncbi:MAG TPA: hypothetical protein VFE80_10460, partial [Beijerinckiaceae bacterium]|nr:hypothetical protein [Beijerinckiaceae bacterium]
MGEAIYIVSLEVGARSPLHGIHYHELPVHNIRKKWAGSLLKVGLARIGEELEDERLQLTTF